MFQPPEQKLNMGCFRLESDLSSPRKGQRRQRPLSPIKTVIRHFATQDWVWLTYSPGPVPAILIRIQLAY